MPFPEPTTPAGSRAEVFLRYLDYFRSRLAAKLESLPAAELTRSRLPSGWTPLELAKHLRYVELRWLEWGFEGRAFADPWADNKDGRWHVGPEESLPSLLAGLDDQAGRTRAIVESHDLDETGQARRPLGQRRPGDPGTGPVPPGPGVRPAPGPAGRRRRTRHRPDRRIIFCRTDTGACPAPCEYPVP